MNGRRSRFRVARLILLAVVALGVAFLITPMATDSEVEWADGSTQVTVVVDGSTPTVATPATADGAPAEVATPTEIEWA